MIRDYSDPKVTLNQVYSASTIGSTAVLGACVIGPNYIIRSYKSNGDAMLIAKDADFKPATGIAAIAYPKLKQGEQVKTSSVKVFVQNAELSYFQISDSVTVGTDGITVTAKDVVFAGKNSTLPIDLQAGDTVSITYMPKSGSAAAVFETTVQDIAYDGKSFALRSTLPQHKSISKINLAKVADVYLSKDSITALANTIAVKAAATTDQLTVCEQTKKFPVIGGNFYAEYAVLDTTYVGKLGVIAASTDDQVEDILGQVCQDNPLALAVACATQAAQGAFVYFTAVEQDTKEAYYDAADLAADNDSIHGIVPCTTNKAILKELLSFVKDQSTAQIPFFKFLYASCDIPTDDEAGITSSDNTKGKKNQKRIEYIYNPENKAVTSERAAIVFADGAQHNGIAVPNYCVAAAIAGLRSASYPHAPLSNVTIPGITVTNEHGFTASQLKVLGSYGFMRVGLNTAGDTIILRQLTSAAADDVNKDEQSIICDIDSIGLNLKTSGTNLVGNSNISRALLDILRVDLESRLRGYTYYVDDYIGPQLISGTVDDIYQDPVHKDRIYATISGDPPKPFNRFHITFRIV